MSRRSTARTIGFACAVLLSLFSREAAAAGQAEDSPCRLFSVLTHTSYKFASEDDRAALDRIRLRLCGEVATKKRTFMQAYARLEAFTFYAGACRDRSVNPDMLAIYPKAAFGKAVSLAHYELCRKVATGVGVETAVKWFRAEYFCSDARYVVQPAGVSGSVLSSAKTWQDLQRKTESLCAAARSGTLSMEDAYYQWRQEVIWVRDHLPADVGSQQAASVRSWISGALEKSWELLPIILPFVLKATLKIP
jgi:hypothetical protein